MGIINALIMAIISALLLWLLYSTIKNKPELFSAGNINKSFFTMGVLAIILIAVIGLTIMLLNS
jgi:hypothetical protein